MSGLRALLIQKDVKQVICKRTVKVGLRALLIQKDVKPTTASTFKGMRLRALLIQKDVKHCSRTLNIVHPFLLKKYSQTF